MVLTGAQGGDSWLNFSYWLALIKFHCPVCLPKKRERIQNRTGSLSFQGVRHPYFKALLKGINGSWNISHTQKESFPFFIDGIKFFLGGF